MASNHGGGTVISMRGRRRTGPPAPEPGGPYVSPSLIPALERFLELLERHRRPGQVTGADIIAHMPPPDRREAGQLAACLHPVLGCPSKRVTSRTRA